MLRGVALLGILIVNMQDFAGFQEWRQQGIDGVVQAITDTLANGRFISIFAMLFGWGAAGLAASQTVTSFARRHLVLLVIGLLHFTLVWHGDIIGNYALLGFFLLLLKRVATPALLWLAGALGGYWLIGTLFTAFTYLSEPAVPRPSYLPVLSAQYGQVVAERASEVLRDLLAGSLYNGPWLLALFCLGAAAQRVGLLARPQQHVPLLRRLGVWGSALGLVLGVLLAYLNTRADLGSGLLAIPVRMAGGLAGGLGYVGLLGLLTTQGRLGWLKRFASSGRMAMSNYLAQSLVMTTVFYPYAGAQWGHWGAASTLLLALAFGGLQVWLSGLLVQRYGTGPMEKLVRWAVYGQRRRQRA